VSHGNLDGSYFLGKALERKPYNDPEYALELITDAAGGGHALALNDLARKYREGKMVPKDPIRALELYSASADRGYWVAARHIAEMYLDGDGIPHDSEQALEWFSRAADSGDQESQYQIARMYETGDGIEKDVDEAMRIYALLAINYSHSAKRFCNEAAYRLGMILEADTDVPADLEDARYWYSKAADKGHKEAYLRLKDLTDKD
jgi:TPR repeat protein